MIIISFIAAILLFKYKILSKVTTFNYKNKVITNLILLIFFSKTSFSQEIVIVGVHNGNNYPFHYIDENQHFQGVYRDVLDLFFSEHKIKPIYLSYNKKELLDNFLNGEIDIKFPDNPFWSSSIKKSSPVIYSKRFGLNIEATFILAKNKDKFTKMNDIKKIGISGDIVAWSIHHDLELNKIEITNESNCEVLLNLLTKETIDACYCNYHVVKTFSEASNLSKDIIIQTYLPYIDDYYYLSTIKKGEIIDKFNKWIKENRIFINDKYKNIIKK